MSEEIIESVLKDFPDAVYYPKFRLMTWHPTGIFDGALADSVREFVEREEYIQDAPFNRYMDLSEITDVQVNLERLSEVARRRRNVSQPIQSAIFADQRHCLVIAQIYESLMEQAGSRLGFFENARRPLSGWAYQLKFYVGPHSVRQSLLGTSQGKFPFQISYQW